MMPVRKIAFGNLCKKDWIAGCHYLKNLFIALKSTEVAPQIVLLDMDTINDTTYEMLLPYVDEVVVYPQTRPLLQRVHWSLQARAGMALGAVHPLEAQLRQSGVDVLFHSKTMGDDFRLPQLVWLPDFQHLRLPHLFDDAEKTRRDIRYRQWAAQAKQIILSSDDALNDLRQFAPQAISKARVLHFVAQVDASVYDVDIQPILVQHQLPERFFYLPNQFWLHKNHRVVIEALAQLQDTDVLVVCSGNTKDYRHPAYFDELMQLADQLGVKERFRVLGMIPQDHILPLMRQSVAVLQPSRFEGWSTTVEEAKSLGKSMILSDIPVHREQNPPQSQYFPVEDAATLAALMRGTWKEGTSGADVALEQAAQQAFPQRQYAFASQFISIVEEALC